MKVELVATYSGRRLHIRDDLFPDFTMCGAYPEHVVWTDYELTDEEPEVAGLRGICKTCRRLARELADGRE